MKKRPENSAGYVTPERIQAAKRLMKVLKRLMAFRYRVWKAGLGQTSNKTLQIKATANLVLDLLAIPGHGIETMPTEGKPFSHYDRDPARQIIQDCIDEHPLNAQREHERIMRAIGLILREAESIKDHYDPLQG